MILINRWIKGSQNFIVGKNLYDVYGADDRLKALFAQGETAFAKQKLLQALTTISAQDKKPLVKSMQEVAAMPKGSDDVLFAIEQEWQPLYQKMNLLRHKLDEFGDDNSSEARANCKLLCENILQLEQKCMALWAKRDYYERHGQLPEIKEKEEKFIIPDDAVELATLISTLKRYIRRYKKKTKEEQGNAIYPALLKKYEMQLHQILNRKK